MTAKEIDMNNFILGKYIAFAFNSPEKYPEKPFLHEEKKKGMSPEEMQRIARAFTKRLGGEIKKK